MIDISHEEAYEFYGRFYIPLYYSRDLQIVILNNKDYAILYSNKLGFGNCQWVSNANDLFPTPRNTKLAKALYGN